MVNVQVNALAPPLEQAPDHMTGRLLVALSVIDVLPGKDAVPVLPTATLIPVGVELTVSPARPVAVTVTFTGTETAVLLLDSATAHPPAGAAVVRRTVPCEAAPPVTVVGFTDTAESGASLT